MYVDVLHAPRLIYRFTSWGLNTSRRYSTRLSFLKRLPAWFVDPCVSCLGPFRTEEEKGVGTRAGEERGAPGGRGEHRGRVSDAATPLLRTPS